MADPCQARRAAGVRGVGTMLGSVLGGHERVILLPSLLQSARVHFCVGLACRSALFSLLVVLRLRLILDFELGVEISFELVYLIQFAGV